MRCYMLAFLPGFIRVIITSILMAANMIFWVSLLLIASFIKVIVPVKPWQRLWYNVSIFISNSWIVCNNLNLALTKKIEWKVTGLEKLKIDEWYLVVSNHQSWVDIVILQKIFLRKIPFLKFFLKKELLWVPVMGPAWWALDFPFMKRYSEAYLAKKPHLRGKDVEITKKGCEKFKTSPVSVMNFVEGTRFSKHKHSKQNSPFKNLLKPKAGGIAFALNTLGEQMKNMVNVTIYYPDGAMTFGQFLYRKEQRAVIHVELVPLSKDLIGDYENNIEFKNRFQNWLNSIWVEKDRLLDEIALQHDRSRKGLQN